MEWDQPVCLRSSLSPPNVGSAIILPAAFLYLPTQINRGPHQEVISPTSVSLWTLIKKGQSTFDLTNGGPKGALQRNKPYCFDLPK